VKNSLKFVTLSALTAFGCLPSCGGGGGSSDSSSFANSPSPEVASVSPANGETGVPLDAQVIVEFNTLLIKGLVHRQSFMVIERGGARVVGNIDFHHVLGPTERLVATFTPVAELSPCTTYDVVLSARILDFLQRPLPAFGSSFTTDGVNCLPPAAPGACVPPVPLGTAETFAVLAGETITSTGPTTLDGDLGLSPGSAVTGSPIVTGATHVADAPALAAQSDLTIAYDAAAALASTATRVGDLGGQILTAGVYTSTSGLAVQSADLILVGGPDDVFVFQMASTLTIGSGRAVVLQGVRACNVVWQVGSSAVIDTDAQFVGTILALTSITLNTGATVEGRVLARNGQVAFASNVVTVP
jgi:hypothetical protein